MKKSLLIASVLLVVILLAACGSTTAQPTADPAAAEPAPLIVEGRLLPASALDQAFTIGGQVREVLVSDGDKVQRGQALARLEPAAEARAAWARADQEMLAAEQALTALRENARLSLAQAQVAWHEAQKNLDAAQELYDEESSAANLARLDAARAQLMLADKRRRSLEANAGLDPDALAAATARLAAADAALASAQAALNAHELRASMAGTVVGINALVGQRVAAGQPLMSVADFSGWRIETTNLTEDQVVAVRVGQPVRVVFDALPQKVFAGTVTRIADRYIEQRGDINYTVTVTLSESDSLLRWGMTAALQFMP